MFRVPKHEDPESVQAPRADRPPLRGGPLEVLLDLGAAAGGGEPHLRGAEDAPGARPARVDDAHRARRAPRGRMSRGERGRRPARRPGVRAAGAGPGGPPAAGAVAAGPGAEVDGGVRSAAPLATGEGPRGPLSPRGRPDGARAGDAPGTPRPDRRRAAMKRGIPIALAL